MAFDPWSLVAEIALTVGSAVVRSLLSTPPPDNRAKSLADAPTSQEGTPIPLLVGTVRVTRPLVAWWGAFSNTMTAGDFYSVGPNGQNIPLNPQLPADTTIYAVNLLLIPGIPMGPIGPLPTARLLSMWVGGTYRFPLGPGPNHAGLSHAQSDQIAVYGTDLIHTFGQIQFFAGTSDQVLVDGLPKPGNQWLTEPTFIGKFMAFAYAASNGASGPDPTTIPGYRNTMLISLTGDYNYKLEQGNNSGPYLLGYALGPEPKLPDFSFEIRTTRQKYHSTNLPGGDADPVAVIYDLLTGAWGKMNIPDAAIDDTSFSAASATLLTEQHGYSRVIDSSRNAKDVLQEIVNQIGGALYQDPYDGLIKLKLIRNDYNPATIPAFTTADLDVRTEPERTVGSWQNIPTQVRVKYTERFFGYQDAVAVAQNHASAVMQDNLTDIGQPGGKIRVIDVEYPGCCYYSLAAQLAARDLQLLATPLETARFTFTRAAHALRPGDVFKLTAPELGVNGLVYRVTKVDLGPRDDNRVVVDCYQDIYTFGATGYTDPGGTIVIIPGPEPIYTRTLTEAPYWMMLKAAQGGWIGSADVQRILAVVRPDDGAPSFFEQTSDGTTWLTDVVKTSVPISALVQTSYARELEPYDTTTGLLIQSFQPASNLAQTLSFAAADIRTYGRALILVGTEIMAYESVTDMGGGVWRLNNVWRGLLDTAPQFIPAGTPIYWIGTRFGGLDFVGRRGWQAIGGVNGRAVPILNLSTGSGEEGIDTIGIALRGTLPARAADFGLAGEVMTGTAGLPSVAAPTGQLGFFKSVSAWEEGFAYTFRKRDRLLDGVSRGDDADETPSDTEPTTWEVWTQKVRSGQTPSAGSADAAVAIKTALTGPNIADGLLVPAYGDVDVILKTVRTIPPHGWIPQQVLTCWDPPKIRVRAERWRNLLANARFDYHGAGTNISPGWSASSGTPTISAGAQSITLNAADSYLGGTASVTAVSTQTIDVSGYAPRGMTARLEFYARTLSGLATTVTAVIEALDAGGASLATTTVNGGPFVPSSGNPYWTRYAGTVVCPANTSKLRVTLTSTSNGTRNDGVFTEVCVRLGQMQYDVLGDSSFESVGGFTTSWTLDTGLWITANGIASPSGKYAQGGAAASSTGHQDYAIPAGWEVGGTAILNCWRAQTLASDSGKVDLQVLDGSNAVIATATTGLETLPVLNQWFKRRLSVDLPAGAAKLRVALTATRTAGVGSSGACFDEMVLELHKDLSDPRYLRSLDFSAPTIQPVPSTWQEWHLAYPSLRLLFADPTVFSGAGPSSKSFPFLTMDWSDGATHAGVDAYGNFGGGVASISALQFTRQSGAGALDYQSFNEQTRFACPAASDAITAVALIRIDEDGFATACGVCGLSDGARGWALEINASGQATAILWGASGTKSISCSASIADGAWHLIGMAYDPIGQTLTVIDEAHTASVSTATGLGEILNTDATVPFRVGRGRSATDTLPGLVGRLFVFDAAMTASQMQSMWSYAKDPTGALSTYTRNQPAWVEGLHVGQDSATLVKMSPSQVALGYSTALTSDGGTGWGLALCKGTQNLCPSFDLASASWVLVGAATRTPGLVDATGRTTGVTIANSSNAPDGIKLIGVSAGVVPNITIVFWLRSTSAVDVSLLNASDVVKQTITVTAPGANAWTKKVVSFTAWDGSTGTCRIRFSKNGASAGSFDLSSVMWVGQGSVIDVPTLIPDPLATMADVTATVTETQLKQLNAEGEIVAVGIASQASPPAARCIATVDNAVNTKNWREIGSGSAQQPRLDHYDATPTDVASQGTAIDWSQLWTIRGRWAASKMLDNAANPYAGVVTVGSVSSAVYGRTATWTYDATANTRIRLGAGTNAAMSALLRSLTVRAREEKLP